MTNFKSYLYNEYQQFYTPGTHVWTKPSDLDDRKPILVHVWGAGGSGSDGASYGSHSGCRGGGGGGLAVKLIDVSSLGATETVTIGGPTNGNTITGVGGTSSFGSHCSATGGNDGYNDTENAGSGTTAGANYGIGGLGIGGDVNRRGGRGGQGYSSASTNAGGGGGGSAPAPYGISDGFDGGPGSTYAGGGGGGIASTGSVGSYNGGHGGSSMARPINSASPTTYYTCSSGAPGLATAAAAGGTVRFGYSTYGGGGGRSPRGPRHQTMFLGPNEILLGGDGGAQGGNYHGGVNNCIPGNGGPGGGGAGYGQMDGYTGYNGAGNGGPLGGGGGGGMYCNSGWGGLAAGSGGMGYASFDARPRGGSGWVIIQYARLV